MSAACVRRYYGVQAKRGGRVIFDGKPGRIVSFKGQYIRVLLDGSKRPLTLHPTWKIEYIEDGAA